MNELLSPLMVAIRLGGVGMLVLVVASLAIPRVLGWRQDTAKLRPLTRQVFWTYAAYIWCTNLWFGLVSLLLAPQLLNRNALAASLTGFIATYWLGRIAVQFFYFDRADAPSGLLPRVGEVGLVLLFAYLALTFTLATLYNVGVM